MVHPGSAGVAKVRRRRRRRRRRREGRKGKERKGEEVFWLLGEEHTSTCTWEKEKGTLLAYLIEALVELLV